MPDLQAKDNLPISVELYNKATEDAKNSANWHQKREEINQHRLAIRRRKNLRYPGAPNFVDPIVDDQITRVTAVMNRILWQPKYIANFIPMSREGFDFKEQVEKAFNYLLGTMLRSRKTFSTAMDCMNEKGLSYVMLGVNDTAYERIFESPQVLPEPMFMHTDNIIIPPQTKNIQDSMRVIRILRYTKDNFALVAENNSWQNWQKVLKMVSSTSEGTEGIHDIDRLQGYHPKMSDRRTKLTDPTVIVHEAYYIDKKGKRKKILYPEISPELVLNEVDWQWKNLSSQRPWPIIALPFEERAEELLDSRGLGELLLDNQKAATQFKNFQAEHMDYHGRPMTRGGNAMMSNKFMRPGGNIPEGVELLFPQEVPQSFALLLDAERQMAALRSGSTFGAQTSGRSSKEPVTATQVNREAINADMITLERVSKLHVEFSDLFHMMWQWCKDERVPLPVINEQFEFESEIDEFIYDLPYQVIASANSRNSDPVFLLNQLVNIMPLLQGNQFVKEDKTASFLLRQIDPTIAEDLVEQGGPGSPIAQALEQLGQQVGFNSQMSQENRQWIAAREQELENEEAVSQ